MNKTNVSVIPVGGLETNCVILFNKDQGVSVIFDPGDDAYKIIDAVEKTGCRPSVIVNTHCHYDHIGAAEEIGKHYSIPFLVHNMEKQYAEDPEKNYSFLSGRPISVHPDRTFVHGDTVGPEAIPLKVIHTPGHTLGSCCFLTDGILISGDTVFAGSVGRTDLYGGSEKEIIASIRNRILVLDDPVIIIPGHGRTTSVGEEKRFNPFF